LVVGNVVMFSAGLSGSAGLARLIFMIIPVVLAVLAGRWQMALGYIVLSGAVFAIEMVCMNSFQGVVAIVVGATMGLIARVLPTAMMGYVTIITIKVSDLMAALERWHMPRPVVIPLAVILRFLPTAFEENRAVATAMEVRGLTVKAVGVKSWVEYRTVPLIIATVNAGEELAQAALTRALGAPLRPSRIADVGFRLYDGIMLAIAAAGLAIWIWGG